MRARQPPTRPDPCMAASCVPRLATHPFINQRHHHRSSAAHHHAVCETPANPAIARPKAAASVQSSAAVRHVGSNAFAEGGARVKSAALHAPPGAPSRAVTSRISASPAGRWQLHKRRATECRGKRDQGRWAFEKRAARKSSTSAAMTCTARLAAALCESCRLGTSLSPEIARRPWAATGIRIRRKLLRSLRNSNSTPRLRQNACV